MAFGDEIRLKISTLFNDSGLQQAQESMQQMQKIANKTGLDMSELRGRMDALNMTVGQNGRIFQQGAEGSLKQSEAARQLSSDYAALSNAAKTAGVPIQNMRNQLENSRMELSQNAQGATMFQDRYTGAMENSQQATKNMRRQTAEFRMEQLSLMFGFMALRRVMSGMLRPAFKAAGVFDTMGSIMEILFTPIALVVQSALLPLLDIVASMPRPVKLLIGALALLVIAFLTLGMIVTQISLATSSIWGKTLGELIMSSSLTSTSITGIFGSMASSVTSILGSMAATVGSIASTIASFITLPVIAAIALIVGAILLLNEAWAKYGKEIKTIVAEIGLAFADVLPMVGTMLENTLLAPINNVIKAVNRLTGMNISTVGEMFDSAAKGLRKSSKQFKENAQESGGPDTGFLGFQLTGEDGVLSGGIGGVTDAVGGALGGAFGFGGGLGMKGMSSATPEVNQTEIKQDIKIERGTGNESDFAFKKGVGRELQKANERSLSKTQGNS